jgi:hypothetical protein
LAIPAGLEPATLCLEGRCSIQLSYGTWPEIHGFLARFGAEPIAQNVNKLRNSGDCGHGIRDIPDNCPMIADSM